MCDHVQISNPMDDNDAQTDWPVATKANVHGRTGGNPYTPMGNLPVIHMPVTPAEITIPRSDPFSNGVVILNEVIPAPQDARATRNTETSNNLLLSKRQVPVDSTTTEIIIQNHGFPCGRIILWI